MKMPSLGAGRSAILVTNGKLRTPGGTPEMGLVSAMLVQAIKDMRGSSDPRKYSVKGRRHRAGESRARATAWLASKSAQSWFDLVGVDQRYALDSMKWVDHARQLLAGADKSEMEPDELAVLRGGVIALDNSNGRVERSKAEKFAYEYGSKARVAFVSGLPCGVCGAGPCHNHHCRTDGMSRKGPSSSVVPLCGKCHTRIHSIGALSILQQMDGFLRLPMISAASYIGKQGRMQYDSFDELAAGVEKLWQSYENGLSE